MSRGVGYVVLAIAAVMAARAEADEGWRATFSAESLAQINAPLDSVMVVAAGSDPARKEAADALLAALRSSGIVTLVIDSSPIGDVSALADRAIVARIQGEPVTTLAIVRVYAGDARPNVVVSFYDKAGRSLGVVSGQEGGVLAASKPPATSPAKPQVSAEALLARAREQLAQVRALAQDGQAGSYQEHVTVTVNGQTTYESTTPRPTAPPVTHAAGTVPVTFTSASPLVPLQVGRYNGTYATVSGYHHNHVYTHWDYRPLCTTPCTLDLRPGAFPVGVRGGYDLSDYHTTVNVPLAGADVQLRVTSWGAYLAGFTLAPFGALAITAGAFTLGEGWHHHDARVAGAAVLGVGGAALAVGLPLLLIHSGVGAASVHPHAATQPTAKLTVGPGSLGFSGVF